MSKAKGKKKKNTAVETAGKVVAGMIDTASFLISLFMLIIGLIAAGVIIYLCVRIGMFIMG